MSSHSPRKSSKYFYHLILYLILMKELNIKKVIIHRSGISYFILEGSMIGTGTFELEFKIDEMDDVLKSLFVLDTSEKGYISSISYLSLIHI